MSKKQHYSVTALIASIICPFALSVEAEGSASKAHPLTLRGDSSVTGQVELQWKSKAGEHYLLYSSDDLRGFTPVSENVPATPPLNTWWMDISLQDKIFFVLVNEAQSWDSELLVNGDFAEGGYGWILDTHHATAYFKKQGNDALIDIRDGGSENWSVQFYDRNLTLRQGVYYTYSFTAKAPGGNRRIITHLQSITDPVGKRYLSKTVELKPEYRTFSFSFYMHDPTDTTVRANFNLGHSELDVAFQSVSLRAGYPRRAAAYELNRRLGRGNNFSASRAVQGHGAPEDYALLNSTGFAHARISYALAKRIGKSGDSVWPTAGWYGVGNIFRDNYGRNSIYGALVSNAYFGANAGNTDPYDESENLIGRGLQLGVIEGNEFDEISRAVWANSATHYLVIRNNEFEVSSAEDILEIPTGHEYPKTQVVIKDNTLR